MRETVCTHLPRNDRCYYPEIPGGGATLAKLPFFATEVDLLRSRTLANEPGFCCLSTDPGGQGVATSWYKFVAESPDPWATTVSVEIDTVGSQGGHVGRTFTGADNSIIQVFSVANPDAGQCDDSSTCSVSAQDCVDGSTCEIRDEKACSQLLPIACSDTDQIGRDGSGASSQPDQASMRITNLTVGQTYYVAIAAEPPTEKHCVYGSVSGDLCTTIDDCDRECVGGIRQNQQCVNNIDCPEGYCSRGNCTDDHRGLYNLTIRSLCSARPNSIPNDPCEDTKQITGTRLSIPFDLSSGNDCAPATFDCPRPNCSERLENDIWYDWIAPANGAVAMDTCASIGETPSNTTIVVYDGCACPVDYLDEIACAEFDAGTRCFSGLGVRFNAVKDQCYKIRLGGRNVGMEMPGELHLTLSTCPEGRVEFLDPPSGTVDARQPFEPTQQDFEQGLSTLHVRAPGGADLLSDSDGHFACWTMCARSTGQLTQSNEITNIVNHRDGTFTLEFLRPNPPGESMTIRYRDGVGQTTKGHFFFHPGNVNGDGLIDGADVVAMFDILTGRSVPIHGIYSADIDRSGSPGPADLLRLIDLLQGAAGYAPGWNGTLLPSIPAGCE